MTPNADDTLPSDTGWSEITGPRYQLKLLDTPARQSIRNLSSIHKNRPSAYLVTTASHDRENFKLLFFPSKSKQRKKILKHYQYAAHSKLLPTLRWQDKNHLLFDYVEGKQPDINCHHFANQLGQQLAKLHQYKRGQRNGYFYRQRCLWQLKNLTQADKLSADSAQQIREILKSQLPTTLPVTLDLGDIQPANFVMTNDNKLQLIDIGCIRSQWPMGQETVGDIHYPEIDQTHFRQGYQSQSADSYIFQHSFVLRVVHLVAKAHLSMNRKKRCKIEPVKKMHRNDLTRRLACLNTTLRNNNEHSHAT